MLPIIASRAMAMKRARPRAFFLAMVLITQTHAADSTPAEMVETIRSLRSTVVAQETTIDDLKRTVADLKRTVADLFTRVAQLEYRVPRDVRQGQEGGLPDDLLVRGTLSEGEQAGSTRIDGSSVTSAVVNAAFINASALHVSALHVHGELLWHGIPVGFKPPTLAPTAAPTMLPVPAPTSVPAPAPTFSPTLPWMAGGEWTLVRRVTAGSTWHPASDHCTGTAVYGSASSDPTVGSTFSVYFANADFDEFLFMTGDGSKWLIASRDQVNGAYYADSGRTITMSSISATPYTARWYNRAGQPEDPWISLVDHGSATCSGQILYGGNNHGGCHATSILPYSNGANVFIRKRTS